MIWGRIFEPRPVNPITDDYETEVEVEQGFLTARAIVKITKDGEYVLTWWQVEGDTMMASFCPEKLQELFFELAEDNMREDEGPFS